jgi:cytochrome c oxidase assembly protein subunit 15
MIEFGNRVVVFVLVVGCFATCIASFLRRPARRDLRWLSGGLILGVIGEAVLGAFVVYSNLNAYVVMVHFMVGMALLAVTVILALAAGHRPGRGSLAVTGGALWLTRALLALVVIVLTAGAATTGAGPHAGGKGAKRIPIGLEDMSRIHAEIVITTVVVLLVLLWVLWRTNAPARNQDAGRILLAVMIVQGIIGYTQFFSHLPPVLVGIHVIGASMVWATALWFHHGLSDHLPEEPGPEDEPSSDGTTSSEPGFHPGSGTTAGAGPRVVREPA